MLPITVYYEDKHLILCEKPAGVLSQGDESGEESMTDWLLAHERERGEPLYAGVVHRLDRRVGGVMVYAKNRNAAGKLSAQVGDKTRFRKEYLAVVHGVPQPKQGEMKDLLFKDTTLGKSYVVDRLRRGVKEASLFYRVLEENNGMSLVYVLLHTGRMHQIRVQFASRKCPLAGDGKYGAADSIRQLGLHAFRLTLTHPVSGKPLTALSLPGESFPWASIPCELLPELREESEEG